MRLSRYFFHTLKEIPSEAFVVSHQLMLRAGFIHQTVSGIYSWLPLGLRVLQKIEAIIAKEQDSIGCHRIQMPTIQPASLWIESGRYEAYGKEMLRIKDRHERDLLYGPTHEEVITDIARQYIKSYRDLPQTLYQISWKFRDEIRPRFGVMRGREFLMKDGYSFDLDFEGAKATYERIFNSYLATFSKMGLKAIPVQADSGAIGGNLSHEFQIMAETGESMLYYDPIYDDIQEKTFESLKDLYATTDEKHDAESAPKNLKEARGIEVGHIFYFGKKYSESMGLKVLGSGGEFIMPEMGSYGIGVSRLVAAIIEAHHDAYGMCWPLSVAPFHVGLLNLKPSDPEITRKVDALYQILQSASIEVLYDDRDVRPGIKFSDMDLIGIPYQIIVGIKSGDEHEVKVRSTGERRLMTLDNIIAMINESSS